MKKILFSFLMVILVGCSATRPIQATPENGVEINGVVWAVSNVGDRGTFVSNPKDYGNYYTFDEAQTACPVGWRLPTHEEFRSLAAAGSEWTTQNGVNGRLFGSGPNSIFLPATGGRTPATGALTHVRSNGYYWSDTPNSTAYGCYLHFNTGEVYSNGHTIRASGFAARCVKE